jgi:small subunit ribosomal protein S16
MLSIRMQRTGRRGHAQYRLIVQDSRFSPTSGRVVAYLGNYDPHTKQAAVNGEKVSKYLDNGAQPSDRVAKLLQKEGIKLPAWVKISPEKTREIRNPEKLRRNRPASAQEPETAADATKDGEHVPETVTEEPAAETDGAIPNEAEDSKSESPEEEPAGEQETLAASAEESEVPKEEA